MYHNQMLKWIFWKLSGSLSPEHGSKCPFRRVKYLIDRFTVLRPIQSPEIFEQPAAGNPTKMGWNIDN